MGDGTYAVVVRAVSSSGPHEVRPDSWPAVYICLFGHFRVFCSGAVVPLRPAGKMERLLCALALRSQQSAAREVLLEELWPGCDHGRASQSLNTLVHDLRRLFVAALASRSPVMRTDDGYGLNVQAGVAVDIVRFDRLAAAAAEHFRLGDPAAAINQYEQAVALYEGDLYVGGGELRTLVERERLRALYLAMLARLADYSFEAGTYTTALGYAQRLLQCDPCREDGHRAVMRCFARLGQRAQAMQQYRLCREVLRQEFEATPEPATENLFTQLRLHPDAV
jgi:DNA-binding SARP family transcriptional activator